jgi:hypothetical protein
MTSSDPTLDFEVEEFRPPTPRPQWYEDEDLMRRLAPSSANEALQPFTAPLTSNNMNDNDDNPVIGSQEEEEAYIQPWQNERKSSMPLLHTAESIIFEPPRPEQQEEDPSFLDLTKQVILQLADHPVPPNIQSLFKELNPNQIATLKKHLREIIELLNHHGHNFTAAAAQ